MPKERFDAGITALPDLYRKKNGADRCPRLAFHIFCYLLAAAPAASEKSQDVQEQVDKVKIQLQCRED